MKVKKAWLVSLDGSITALTNLQGKELSFKDLYPMIGNGCHIIEHVSLKKGVDMWVDEEGLLKENWMNVKATSMYRSAFPRGVFPGEDNTALTIVGNVVITDNTKAGDFIIDHHEVL